MWLGPGEVLPALAWLVYYNKVFVVSLAESLDMPYQIRRVSGGYKVAKKAGKTFSKKPLSHERAVAQLRAIQMHEHGRKDYAAHSPDPGTNIARLTREHRFPTRAQTIAVGISEAREEGARIPKYPGKLPRR